MASELGVAGLRSFVLQHELFGMGRTYVVTDAQKRHLFSVRMEYQSNEPFEIAEPPEPAASGFHVQRVQITGGRTRTSAWAVVAPTGNAVGTVSDHIQRTHAVSTLTDAAGNTLLFVNVEEGNLGRFGATAESSDGRRLFEARGNILRHDFSLHDRLGAEVAKVHEAWGSIRDAFQLEIMVPVDALTALIFVILLDREKSTPAQQEHEHHPEHLKFR